MRHFWGVDGTVLCSVVEMTWINTCGKIHRTVYKKSQFYCTIPYLSAVYHLSVCLSVHPSWVRPRALLKDEDNPVPLSPWSSKHRPQTWHPGVLQSKSLYSNFWKERKVSILLKIKTTTNRISDWIRWVISPFWASFESAVSWKVSTVLSCRCKWPQGGQWER